MNPEKIARTAFLRDPEGVLSSAELRAAGLGKVSLAALVRNGHLVRVTPGMYALPADLPAERALARLGVAVERRLQGRVVMSHHTALAALGLPLMQRKLPMDVAHLTYRERGCSRSRSDHVLHRAPPEAPLSGAVGPASALVQVGSVWGERPFVVAADAALRAGLTSHAEIESVLARRTNLAAHPCLKRALQRLDPLSESPGESLLRLLLLDLGFEVESQVAVVTGRGAYRLDFAVTGMKVAVEFDGLGKYDARPDARRAEKRREEDLRTADWEVVRCQWTDLDDTAEVARRVRWALARARPR